MATWRHGCAGGCGGWIALRQPPVEGERYYCDPCRARIAEEARAHDVELAAVQADMAALEADEAASLAAGSRLEGREARRKGIVARTRELLGG